MRSRNPAFTRGAWQEPAQSWADVALQSGGDGVPVAASRPRTMTLQGTVNKCFFLLTLCVGTALLGWNGFLYWDWNPMLILLGGGLGGFVLAMICSFAPKTAPVTAPMYALAEGVFVGGISGMYASRFAKPAADAATTAAASSEGLNLNTGLVLNAILLTFGIFGGMLVGYTTKTIRPGPIMNKIAITALFGLIIYMGLAFVASLFGSMSLISVYDPSNGGMISIGFSLLVVGLASYFLLMDFQFIEEGAQRGLPRYMEWYAGFGLLVTVVWLYLELLRLLAKLSSRD